MAGLAKTLKELVRGGAEAAIFLAGAPLLRRWYNHWGATEDERVEPLPGDDLVPRPTLGYTRAITIDAPPEDVWRWLIQLGRGRGGFYSYDALENLVGCDIQSADRILPEHQQVAVGDIIRAGPNPRDARWEVMAVDPPHHLVLMGADPRTGAAPPLRDPVPEHGYVASTWQWVLRPVKGGRSGKGPVGAPRTRLVVRQRLAYSSDQRILWHVVEPLNFVMERAMMRGIAERATAPGD